MNCWREMYDVLMRVGPRRNGGLIVGFATERWRGEGRLVLVEGVMAGSVVRRRGGIGCVLREELMMLLTRGR